MRIALPAYENLKKARPADVFPKFLEAERSSVPPKRNGKNPQTRFRLICLDFENAGR